MGQYFKNRNDLITFVGAILILLNILSGSALIAQAASFAYIPNSYSDNVSVIDTSSNTVIATVTVGDYPFGVAVNPTGTRAYVTNYNSKNVSVIDTSNNTVIASVLVGTSPSGVAVNPEGTRVYVANTGSGNVSVIDTSNNTVTASISVGNSPWGVAVNPTGTRVYVANSGSLSMIDTSNNTVTNITVGDYPHGVAVNPEGTRVYVTNKNSDNVSVIDTSNNTVTATVPVGDGPWGVAVNPTGTRVYVTNELSDNVSVIDTSNNTVIATVPVGTHPSGVAVNPTGTYVYVVNADSDNVSVIDTSTNAVTATVAVGDTPRALGIFITGPDIYVNQTGWWRAGGAFNASDTRIQAAIDNATAGDTIYVNAGNYSENVNVNRAVTLQGEGAGVVNVTAASASDHVFEVIVDYVNISGFKVSGATVYPKAGIYLSSNHSNISDNNASNNNIGIYLESSSNNMLTNNNASNNDDGIWLQVSSNNMLTNNTASNNGVGIYLISSSNNNTLTSNTANSNVLYGIYLESSSNNNTLTNNNASNNDDGIYLQVSSNNTLTNNNASNNYIGIYLLSSSNNTLTNNTANSNTQRGINLQSSSNNNTLTNNTANSNTYYGIVLESSSNNTIYNNYFNNTNNAYDSGYNVWNTTITAGTNIVGGSSLGGNYWSNYAGEDTDGDRLGDTLTPYNSGNITHGGDYHPLMTVDTTAPSITIISPENRTYLTASILLNVTTNQTANVTYSLNGNINQSLYNLATSGNATITGTEGANNITVYANDSVGNLNSSIVYFTVATAPVVTASKTYSNYTQITQMTIDPDINVTDGETNVTGATVSIGIGYVSSEDYLNYTTINAITGSYNTTTGILTLTGNRSGSDYQAAFRNVSYWNSNTNNPNTNQRNITFAIGNNSLYYPGTGHYYEFVSASLSWTNARNAAAARTFYGLQGYLATITSAGENDFLQTKVSGDAWIGANDSVVEGEWRWVIGPEGTEEGGKGRQFWQGAAGGYAVIGNYSKWNTSEPNDANNLEDFAQMYSTGGGYWNDLPITSTLSYFTEYGGMAGDPTLHLTAMIIVNVTDIMPPTAPTVTVPTNGTTLASAYTWVNGTKSADTANITVYVNGSITNYSVSVSGMIFNISNVPLGTDGNHQINVSAKDAAGNVNATNATVVVTVDATEPLWAPEPSNQNVELGTAFSYDVNATDLQTITYAVNDTTNFTIGSTNGTVTNITSLNVRIYGLNITATDSSGNLNYSVISVTVQDDTEPLWAPEPSNQTLIAGSDFIYDVNATDLQTITYGINDSQNFSINATTGTITNNVSLTSGIYGLNITATDASSNVNSSSIIIKVNNPPPANSSGGGGGGGSGGGGVITAEPFENIASSERIEKDLAAGKSVTYTFTKNQDVVYEVSVIGKENENKVTIRIEILKGISKQVTGSAPGLVYRNVNIFAGTKKIGENVIKFKVKDSWLQENGFDSSDIRLVKWVDNKWITLETGVLFNKDGYTHFSAKSMTFSIYAITGIKNEVSMPVPLVTEKLASTYETTPLTTEEPTPAPDGKIPWLWMVLAVLLIAASVYAWKKR